MSAKEIAAVGTRYSPVSPRELESLADGVLDDDGGRLVLTEWDGLSALAEGEAD
jgi:hypothetical protein